MELIRSVSEVSAYCNVNRAVLDDIWQNWASVEADVLDQYVHEANERIAARIDCTQCGNCCKVLMINVTDEEALHLSTHLDMPVADFEAQYLEKGLGTTNIMKAMPCHFLRENKCTIYEQRFAGCREFPALHLNGVRKRLFNLAMHIDRCPIIFNVVMDVEHRLRSYEQ